MAKPQPPQMTDDQRRHFEEALAAALLLLYRGKQAEARAQLGLLEDAGDLSPEVAAKMEAFAADRAELVQTGINQRLQSVVDSLPDDASSADVTAAVEQAQREITDYNAGALTAFIVSYAAHQALIDTYTETPNPGDTSQTMADAVQWTWTRNTDAEPDECQAAQDASPASLDELLGIAGSEPPTHPNCQCDLTVSSP